MAFFETYLKTMRRYYPQATSDPRAPTELINKNLICAHPLKLDPTVADQAQKIVSAFHALRQSTAWQSYVLEQLVAEEQSEGLSDARRSTNAAVDAKNFSALMSYDFHLHDGELKLIEINTNASAGLVVDLIYKTAGEISHWGEDFRKTIFETFVNELNLTGPSASPANSMAIVDHDPEKQKMFIEFLLYRELFKTSGFSCAILDPRQLRFDLTAKRLKTGEGRNLDLIYNRHTDFYLETDETLELQKAWRSQSACLSPNPREYSLLADKARLLNLSKLLGENDDVENLRETFSLRNEDASAIAKTVLKTIDVATTEPEELWTQRKKFFFKPKRAFGGKAAYRGSTVTRTMFNKQIASNDYVAQEFAPPSTITLPTDENGPGGDYKVDLRFYAYADRIQLGAGRFYQGQTTNFQNPGGGMARLQIL